MSTLPPRKINTLTVMSVSRQRSLYESVTKCRPWPTRKINIPTVSQSSKISVWVCDKMSTWPPPKINILTVSQSSKISVWVCDKMSTWLPRKINILTVSQSPKISVWLCDKMSTWPPRKINTLTVSQSVKDLCMSLWQNVDLTAAKNQHPNWQSVVKDVLHESVTKCRPDRREKSTS